MSRTSLTDRIKRAGYGIKLTYDIDNKPAGFVVNPFRLTPTQIKFNADNKEAIIDELIYLADKYFFEDRFYCRDCVQHCKRNIDLYSFRCDRFIGK